MRRRFNRNAICSSDNYRVSKKAHIDMLKEKHSHFCNMVVSGEITIDAPIIEEGTVTPKFKTITIFGKQMTISIKEYETHCAHLDL